MRNWESQSISLQPSIERRPAQTERFGRLADVAVEPRHRLLDEEAFNLLEAHILDSRRGIAIDA